MRIHLAWLALAAVLLALCLLQRVTVSHLLTTNQNLLLAAEMERTRIKVIPDARLTVFQNADNSITIVVNGTYIHRIPLACGFSL